MQRGGGSLTCGSLSGSFGALHRPLLTPSHSSHPTRWNARMPASATFRSVGTCTIHGVCACRQSCVRTLQKTCPHSGSECCVSMLQAYTGRHLACSRTTTASLQLSSFFYAGLSGASGQQAMQAQSGRGIQVILPSVWAGLVGTKGQRTCCCRPPRLRHRPAAHVEQVCTFTNSTSPHPQSMLCWASQHS